MSSVGYVLANFGGPRHREEVVEFLVELLTDQEVIRTPFPAWMHRLVFTRVAKKRGKKVVEDYDLIGGHSPIYKDTEQLAQEISNTLKSEVITFHRYLPQTHAMFIEKVQTLAGASEIRVVPLFPQFSYATTGSIALWFSKRLPPSILSKIRWNRSYASNARYIAVMQRTLQDFLDGNGLDPKKTLLLFSAHGLPQEFIDTGDPYQQECERSFTAIKEAFPESISLLSYQSQFGKKPWILPYTSQVCQEIELYAQGRQQVVIIPLSFTSDHIETLYEVEYTYVRPLRERGFQAFRCPALNLCVDWVKVVVGLFDEAKTSNVDLIREKSLSSQKIEGCS